MNIFDEGDVVKIKDTVPNYNYSDLSKDTEYTVRKVDSVGKILLKGRYSTNYYTPKNFVLVKKAAGKKNAKLLIVSYPNITSVVGYAQNVDEARTKVTELLKKYPFNEFAILGIIDTAKLQVAPVVWATDKADEIRPNPIELHENTVYKNDYDGTTIVGTLKDRLKTRS